MKPHTHQANEGRRRRERGGQRRVRFNWFPFFPLPALIRIKQSEIAVWQQQLTSIFACNNSKLLLYSSSKEKQKLECGRGRQRSPL